MRTRITLFAPAFLLLVLVSGSAGSEEPALPRGLEDQGPQQGSEGPGLPPGLGGGRDQTPSGPSLPEGLGAGDPAEEAKPSEEEKRPWALPQGVGGYWEVRGGARVRDDPVQDRVSLAEARLQLGYDQVLADYLPRGRFRFTGDLVLDAVDEDRADVDLERGEGFVDLWELWLSLTPVSFLDLKVGRQVLTWGTGNFVFLNDLFPKDYPSFFLGRHVDYLKAPSDAVRASLYSPVLNMDLVYTPRFDADRFVDGSRLSFFDPSLGNYRGEDRALDTDRPDEWFRDDEIAARLHRNLGPYEVAAYGYDGFWKSPAGTDPGSGKQTFPELSVLGASLRGPTGPGIGNAELAWYVSRDDRDGDDPAVANSQLRLLVGYEQEVLTDLTLGVQYYLERLLNYEAYRNNLPSGFPAREEDRQWITVDLSYELLAQNQLRLGLFTFWSVSAPDAYLRPKITYDYTDRWKLQAGANLFFGDREEFFGRFRKNDNVYAAVRYGF